MMIFLTTLHSLKTITTFFDKLATSTRAKNEKFNTGHDLIGKGHVAYQSVRIVTVSLNTSMVISSPYLVSIKSYSRKTAGELS